MNISLREQIFRLVNVSDNKQFAGRIADWGILFLILINVLAALLESIDSIYIRFHQQFVLLKSISIALFTIEYLVRVWTCTQHSPQCHRQPILGRLHYILTPLMLIDLLVILSFYAHFRTAFDFRFLRLFRFLSISQITRNSRSLQLLLSVIKREGQTLLVIFVIMAVLLVLISSTIYALEHNTQPDNFSSIPHAMWWTIATLSTVGYGDVVPQTMPGKFFGTIVMLIGIAMFAIPTGILVSSFYQEMKRKDFIATWDLVAQVPYFSQLSATEIGRIADLLRLHVVRAGEVIFYEGDDPDSMYFIVSGKVEINKNGKLIEAKGGDFFGEIGVLYKTPRIAKITAKTYVELLQLDIKDLEQFLESHPKFRTRILEEAEKRRSNSPSK
jgi:voltage-gated potassium channel